MPTDSTRPATSVPGMRFFGLSRPAPMRRRTYGRPLTTCQTSGWTEAAWTRTSTSSSLIAGSSTSPSCRTSAGGPYLTWTIAFMVSNLRYPAIDHLARQRSSSPLRRLGRVLTRVWNLRGLPFAAHEHEGAAVEGTQRRHHLRRLRRVTLG